MTPAQIEAEKQAALQSTPTFFGGGGRGSAAEPAAIPSTSFPIGRQPPKKLSPFGGATAASARPQVAATPQALPSPSAAWPSTPMSTAAAQQSAEPEDAKASSRAATIFGRLGAASAPAASTKPAHVCSSRQKLSLQHSQCEPCLYVIQTRITHAEHLAQILCAVRMCFPRQALLASSSAVWGGGLCDVMCVNALGRCQRLPAQGLQRTPQPRRAAPRGLGPACRRCRCLARSAPRRVPALARRLSQALESLHQWVGPAQSPWQTMQTPPPA